jgi:polar amino acid transport system substrate-binding protein
MRPLRLLLVGLLVLALGACASFSTGDGGSSERLERILSRRELRVGLSGEQPPLNMRDKRGEVIGLEVDLVATLAQSMGLRARFVTMPFAELLGALAAGSVDMVISGMTITPERNARVAFAGPYIVSGKSVLTRAGTITDVASAAALDDPVRTYAALAGSTSERFVEESLPRATLVSTPDYETAVQMVVDGKVDALVADFPFCEFAVLRHPRAGLTSLATPFTIEPLGIALPADDPLLVNLVENYLSTLEHTGILTQLKAKWFSPGDWMAELP